MPVPDAGMARTATQADGVTDKDAALLEALVRTPSVTGQEEDAVRFLQDQARADGFVVREDAAGNFIAQTGRGTRTLLFVGHIDTVPGDIPVRIKDGVLWGRGSVDAKGSLAAAYCAARRHRDSPLRILIVGAVDEEGSSRGARSLDVPHPDWIINGEPSGVHGLTLGYKGIVRGSFQVETPAMHGAHAGSNAADRAVAWWTDVRDRLDAGEAFDDNQARLDGLGTSDDGTMMRCTGRFQVRLPPPVTPRWVEATLAEAATAHGVHVDVHEALAPATADRRNALVAAFSSAIRAGGGTPRLQRKTGTSDFNVLAPRYPGVPIVAYGPGDASLDHTPDERLDLEEFTRSVDVLDAVFARLAQATQD